MASVIDSSPIPVRVQVAATLCQMAAELRKSGANIPSDEDVLGIADGFAKQAKSIVDGLFDEQPEQQILEANVIPFTGKRP